MLKLLFYNNISPFKMLDYKCRMWINYIITHLFIYSTHIFSMNWKTSLNVRNLFQTCEIYCYVNGTMNNHSILLCFLLQLFTRDLNMQQNLISASNCSLKLAVISETLSATVFRDKEMCLEAWILSGHNFGGVDEGLLYKFAFTKKNLEFSANSCAFA